MLPIKSTGRRPSPPLPAGLWKKLSPFGVGTGPKAANPPPVSELESPKLYIAGKRQPERLLTSLPPTPNPIHPMPPYIYIYNRGIFNFYIRWGKIIYEINNWYF